MRCGPAACWSGRSWSTLRAGHYLLWLCCVLALALTACAAQTFCNGPEVPRFDHDQIGYTLPRLREQWPWFTGDACPALLCTLSAMGRQPCRASTAPLTRTPPWRSKLFTLRTHAEAAASMVLCSFLLASL